MPASSRSNAVHQLGPVDALLLRNGELAQSARGDLEVSEPERRVRHVDGLRGIAAIAVIFCHTALLTPIWSAILIRPAHVPMPVLGHIFVDGAHGVDLFFVLSGFCLAYPSLARLHARGDAAFDIARFATHRIVRLLPPYYIATAVFLLVASVVWFQTRRFALPGSGPYHPTDLIGQFFLLDRGVVLASPPFWTLLVEARWYIAFPVVLFILFRAPRVFGALIVTLPIAYFFTRMHNLDLGVAAAFLLGVLAADLEVRNHPIRRYALPLTFVALAIGLALESSTSMPDADGVDLSFFYWQTNPGWHLTAFFAVLAAGRVDALRALLSLRLPVFLGETSYSIYLMHFPIVMAVGTRLLVGSRPLGFVATVAAAITGGILFWAIAERHFCRGPIRDRARAATEPVVTRCFEWLGLPIVIHSRQLSTEERARTALLASDPYGSV